MKKYLIWCIIFAVVSGAWISNYYLGLHDIIGSDGKLKLEYRQCSDNNDCTYVLKSCAEALAVNKSSSNKIVEKITHKPWEGIIRQPKVNCEGRIDPGAINIKCVEGLCEYIPRNAK